MISMSDLTACATLSVDDETTYSGWYFNDRRWNGFLCVLFDDETAERFVSDYNAAMVEVPQDSMLDFDGDEIIEIAPYTGGERMGVAKRVTVDGVSLWDFSDSGFTWGELEDADA